MGKTFHSLPEDAKTETVSKLRQKLNDRKAQILRLKRVIRELEKKLEKAGQPTKDSEKWQKQQKQVVNKDQQIQELKQRLKEQFGAKRNN